MSFKFEVVLVPSSSVFRRLLGRLLFAIGFVETAYRVMFSSVSVSYEVDRESEPPPERPYDA